MQELIGKNITLVPVRPMHIAEICVWSESLAESYFLLDSALPLSTDRLALEIADKARQLFIVQDSKGISQGIIKAFNLDFTHKRGALHFTMRPSKNNTKLMGEALLLLCATINKKQGIINFFTQCFTTETEYKKVLAQAGAQLAGTLRNHSILNGTSVSVDIMQLHYKG